MVITIKSQDGESRRSSNKSQNQESNFLSFDFRLCGGTIIDRYLILLSPYLEARCRDLVPRFDLMLHAIVYFKLCLF